MAISENKLKNGIRKSRTGFRVPAEYKTLIEEITAKKKAGPGWYHNHSEADIVIEALILLAEKLKVKITD